MAAVMDVFKIKPFDLEPVFAAWTPGPTFHGNPKKDMPVDDWLIEVKKGCREHHVPKEYWHKVGYHFMGPKAKERLDEVKKVMRNMHGGKYKWNWKSFKVAMKNMGWDIEADKTEEIKVQGKLSGIWWIVGRGRSDSVDKGKESNDDAASVTSVESSPPRPPPKRSKTTWDIATLKSSFPTPRRSSTMSNIETVSTSSPSPPPTPPKTPPKKVRVQKTEKTEKGEKNEKSIVVAAQPSAPVPVTSQANNETTVAQAPVWLINACQALDFLTTEHPKVMTAVSAVLITVGSIPAIPAISAGAGGAFLASGTAHALGSIAVGIGSWLKATSEQQAPANPPQPAQGQIQAVPSH